jgi:hypothetical protein
VLEAQQLVAALLRRDVAADAVVAGEGAVLVEQRLGAEGEPDAAAVGAEALDLEIAERLVALEVAAVLLPVVVGRVEPGLLGELVRGVGQAQVPVHLPVPVGEEAAEMGNVVHRRRPTNRDKAEHFTAPPGAPAIAGRTTEQVFILL